MPRPVRSWSYILLVALLLSAAFLFYPNQNYLRRTIQATTPEIEDNHPPVLGAESDPTKLYYAATKGSAVQSRVASYNILQSKEHARTPLFIAFTRNNHMLVQTVLSYISAGWAPTDIIVVDNSGTMDANPKGMLSTANPFYLDVELLLSRYGVSVLQTPTLLTFAQLQNFFLRTAMATGPSFSGRIWMSWSSQTKPPRPTDRSTRMFWVFLVNVRTAWIHGPSNGSLMII